MRSDPCKASESKPSERVRVLLLSNREDGAEIRRGEDSARRIRSVDGWEELSGVSRQEIARSEERAKIDQGSSVTLDSIGRDGGGVFRGELILESGFSLQEISFRESRDGRVE